MLFLACNYGSSDAFRQLVWEGSLLGTVKCGVSTPETKCDMEADPKTARLVQTVFKGWNNETRGRFK